MRIRIRIFELDLDLDSNLKKHESGFGFEKTLTDSSSNGFALWDTDHNPIGFRFKEKGVDLDSDSRFNGRGGFGCEMPGFAHHWFRLSSGTINLRPSGVVGDPGIHNFGTMHHLSRTLDFYHFPMTLDLSHSFFNVLDFSHLNSSMQIYAG